MRLQLQIDMPLTIDIEKIGEVFPDVQWFTPGITVTSDGKQRSFLQMVIDGAKELTEAQLNFLREHGYHLAFIKPMRIPISEDEPDNPFALDRRLSGE